MVNNNCFEKTKVEEKWVVVKALKWARSRLRYCVGPSLGSIITHPCFVFWRLICVQKSSPLEMKFQFELECVEENKKFCATFCSKNLTMKKLHSAAENILLFFFNYVCTCVEDYSRNYFEQFKRMASTSMNTPC